MIDGIVYRILIFCIKVKDFNSGYAYPAASNSFDLDAMR
jgi:hypothetical protein